MCHESSIVIESRRSRVGFLFSNLYNWKGHVKPLILDVVRMGASLSYGTCKLGCAVSCAGGGVPAVIWRPLFRAEGLRLEEPRPPFYVSSPSPLIIGKSPRHIPANGTPPPVPLARPRLCRALWGGARLRFPKSRPFHFLSFRGLALAVLQAGLDGFDPFDDKGIAIFDEPFEFLPLLHADRIRDR